jgi:hypothetical protein
VAAERGEARDHAAQRVLQWQATQHREFARKIGSIGGDIYIGVPANGGQPWRGSMDELSIFNHAMTPQQVAAHVQSFGLVR